MNWKVLFPGSYAGADMASGDDCTWTTTSVRTVNESPEAKLKRLESEQRRVADELGAVRKQIEDAKKPPKTRGEEVVEKCWWKTGAEIARAVDAEIAAAKAEQREADEKIVRQCRFATIDDIITAIRNQK